MKVYKSLPVGGIKSIVPKEFDSNKYNSNSSKCFLEEVDLEYIKELHELHNDTMIIPKLQTKWKSKYKCCSNTN